MLRDNLNELKVLRSRGLTFKKIGERFNCSRERIRQILTFPLAIPKEYKCIICKETIFSFRYRKFCDKHRIQLCGKDYLRELVRIRDKYNCQKCGKKWKEGRRSFDDVSDIKEESPSCVFKSSPLSSNTETLARESTNEKVEVWEFLNIDFCDISIVFVFKMI